LSQPVSPSSETAVELGGALFRHRGWLPVPFLVGLVIVAEPSASTVLLGMGAALPFEASRIWAARAIGPTSRTRGTTPGPLAQAGPYRYSRNPLYIANIGLFASFAWASGSWLGVLLPAALVPYYSLIVRWEEARLSLVHGDAYRALTDRVPRWFGRPGEPVPDAVPHASWSAALRAERGTLVALLLIFSALAVRIAV
jgi:protein-S-isoprenylcysteine O-methyltransferase Ste14